MRKFLVCMLSTTDIVILVVAVAAGGWGAWRGFIAQLGSLVAILAAIVGCQIWGDNVSAWLGVNTILAWVILFVIIYLGVILLANMIRGAAHTLHLGPVDRFFGAVFYIFKWLVLASLLINVWLAFKPDAGIDRGVVTPSVTRLAPRLLGYMAQYVNIPLPNN